MRYFYLSLFILVYGVESMGAEWVSGNKVRDVAVKYGNGCAKLENGEVIKFDLETEAGRAEFSLALAAKASGSKLEVYKTDGSLVGGCDTGTTIRPHSMVRIVD